MGAHRSTGRLGNAGTSGQTRGEVSHSDRYEHTRRWPAVSAYLAARSGLRLRSDRVSDAKALQDQLLSAYQAMCKDGWPSGPNDTYFFTHLRQHLIKAGRLAELADLLQELRWLEAKSEAGLTFDLTADFRDVLRVLPADDSRCKTLDLLNEALRRDIHFIDRHAKHYPQALFQCFWNRCRWHDGPEAEHHYSVPTTVLPPWAAPVPRISEIVARWRVEKERLTKFVWVRSLLPPGDRLGSQQRAVFSGHEGSISGLACAQNSPEFLSSGVDGTIRVWDLTSGVQLGVGAQGFWDHLRRHHSGR